MPTELTMVGLAGVLVIAQLFLAAAPRALSAGLGWAAGPRDRAPNFTTVSERGHRADRAYRNMLETFPVFVAAAVAVVVADATSALTALGAQLYVVARVAYVPAYIYHVPFVRSTVWTVAMAGIALTLWPLIRGAFP